MIVHMEHPRTNTTPEGILAANENKRLYEIEESMNIEDVVAMHRKGF